MFDDLMGYAYGVAINDLDRIAYTAYLKINFKVPLTENTDVILVVSLDKYRVGKYISKPEWRMSMVQQYIQMLKVCMFSQEVNIQI